MSAVPIALCITDLGLGGAERCLTELAVRLDRERFDPTVYCLAPLPKDRVFSCVPRLEAAGVPVVSLETSRSVAAPMAVWRLAAHLRRQRPAVVQSFLFHANVVARLAARLVGVGCVVSGVRVAEPRRWHLRLDRATHRMVDAYVCVSRAVAEFSHSVARLPAEKLRVIPNGVDLSTYSATVPVSHAELGVPDRARLVVCIGRLAEQKGQAWLLRTADGWMQDRQEVHLALIGDGPDRAKLEAAARKAGLAGRVHLTGRRADVPQVLAAAELLVLPSIWEGMPNVLLEAMASGLPVVATDVEGVDELLGPVVAEQIVPRGDDARLTERIGQLLDDRAFAARLGQANRRRAADHFAIESIVEQYERLWWELAFGRRSS